MATRDLTREEIMAPFIGLYSAGVAAGKKKARRQRPRRIPLEAVAGRMAMERWRRRMTLRELGQKLGIDHAALWRVERRKVPKAVIVFELVRDWLAGEES